jgi:plastocyanin domain-containing protein
MTGGLPLKARHRAGKATARIWPLIAGGAAVLGVIVVLLIFWAALRPSPAGFASAREGTAQPGPDNVQEIYIQAHNGEYEPNVIHAKAGVPLRLRVARQDSHSCTDRIIIPDLHAEFALPAGGTGVFIVPAAPRGEYLFTCEKRMVRGVLLME